MTKIQRVIQESLTVSQLNTENFIQPLRADQDERLSAAGIVQCIDQGDQPVKVVTMKMRDKNIFKPGKPRFVF
ncbi:hypothetical protein FQZ97_1021630 [compost metagenome]